MWQMIVESKCLEIHQKQYIYYHLRIYLISPCRYVSQGNIALWKPIWLGQRTMVDTSRTESGQRGFQSRLHDDATSDGNST